MTTYYAYARTAVGATWTEIEELVTFSGPDRPVNQPSSLTLILRDEGGATMQSWGITSIGKHMLLTNATFSGTTGAGTLWHGRVRDIRSNLMGQVSVYGEDWMGQLYDHRDRFTTRRILRSRSASGYGEINDDDEMRTITAFSGTTITDASATYATNDVWNDTCAVVLLEQKDSHRTRRLDDFKVQDIRYKPVALHSGGSRENVGITESWNHTNRYTNSLVFAPAVALMGANLKAQFRVYYHIPFYTTNSTMLEMTLYWGAYCDIDTTCSTVFAEIWNHSNSVWDAFTGTTSGGTAFNGEFTATGYKSVEKHYDPGNVGDFVYADAKGMAKVRFRQNQFSTSDPEIALHYAKITVWTKTPTEARMVKMFPITDCRVTGDTVVIASSESFAAAGIATSDAYTVAKRSDLYVADIVAAHDYQVALSTSGIAQNPVMDHYPNMEWIGSSPMQPVSELSLFDKTDFWVNPTTDTFYYNQTPDYTPGTSVHLQDTVDTFDIVSLYYDFDHLYTHVEVYGHTWGRDDTDSGQVFQVRYSIGNADAEADYNIEREHALVHPGVVCAYSAMTYAQSFLAAHATPLLRVKVRKPGYYSSVGIGDVLKITSAKHELQHLLYCWHWSYDHQNDLTTLELKGPADSYSVSRPTSFAAELAFMKWRSSELERHRGYAFDFDGHSTFGRPRGFGPNR